MKKRIDNILLCMLWVLAVMLGACFWFKSMFGFNLLSGAHWRYLAYLQASNTHVASGFYISLVIIAIVLIGGMYIFMRPRMRRVKFADAPKQTPPTQQPTPQSPTQNALDNNASEIDILPATFQSAPPTPPSNAPSPMRPPRLTIPTARPNNYPAAPIATAPTPRDLSGTLRTVFEQAGYTVKSNPKIGPVKVSLLAIGANETLWVGATDVKTTDMRTAIDKLQNVFRDTLEDIEISVNGFVIGAPDAAVSEFQDILMFDTVDALAEYMRAHPNPPISDEEMANFDAYSAYISTVAEYIGKI